MRAGAIGGPAAARRTFQPVRRESLDVDDPRAQVFRPIVGGHKFVDKWVAGYRKWGIQTKQHGKQRRLNANYGELLEVIMRQCTDYPTGICEPCYDTLQRLTGFCRQTIADGIKVLEESGFLCKLRRTERTGNPPGEGPQVRQVSTAYWFDLAALPKRVAMWIKAELRKHDVVVEIPRERRQPIFGGRWKRRAEERRRSQYDRRAAATLAERAAMDAPDDPEAQRWLLESWSASLPGRENPSGSTEREAESGREGGPTRLP